MNHVQSSSLWMMLRLALLLALTGFTLAGCVANSPPSPSHPIVETMPATRPTATATWENAQVTLWEPAKPGENRFIGQVDLTLVLPRGGIVGCQVLHEANLAGHRYYLLDVEAESRPNNPMSMCGAGIERAIVWIHFGKEWSIQAIQMSLYESCWQWLWGQRLDSGRAIRITVHSRTGSQVMIFDRSRPQDGLRIDPR